MIDDLLSRLKDHEQGNDVETHELLMEAYNGIEDLLDKLQWAMEFADHKASCGIQNGKLIDCSCGFSEMYCAIEQ